MLRDLMGTVGGLTTVLAIVLACGVERASAQPFPGGLPACQAQLNACTTDLGTCTTDLGSCTTDLGSCTTDLQTCQAALAAAQPFPATGQTTCWSAGFEIPCAGTGQDGEIQAGATLSYTDNGDGTITDNNTRLMWEKKTDANVNDNYTWYTALDYVASLNAMKFAGHNDWRMPNQRELLSIVDYSRTDSPIDPVFGPTRGISNYCSFWSSTSSASIPLQAAWSVDFARDGGDIVLFGKGSALHVRAVRGGQ